MYFICKEEEIHVTSLRFVSTIPCVYKLYSMQLGKTPPYNWPLRPPDSFNILGGQSFVEPRKAPPNMVSGIYL